MSHMSQESQGIHQGTHRGTCLVETVFPDHANHYGTLFGGTALSLMGKAAYIEAVRHARKPVVMAASHRIDFRRPVRVGELIEFTAKVERVGRSSMTVAVSGVAETPATGERKIALEGRFEMVAVDARGRPAPIGDIELAENMEGLLS